MASKGRKFTLSWSVDHMLPTIFSLYAFFLCSSLLYCSAVDTIRFNGSINDGGETLVSAGKIFELGFFTPNESSGSSPRYVGIWYYNITPRTVVWVANRDRPLSDGKGSFAITEDGMLNVLDGKRKSYWSTEVEFWSLSTHSNATLMDSGNLILRDDTSTATLWESFRNLTDTFLPGMVMDEDLQLTSWSSGDNPAKGNFTFQKYGSADRFIIWKGSTHQYWMSDADQLPYDVAELLSNFSDNSKPQAANLEPVTGSTGAANTAVASCRRGSNHYASCLPTTSQGGTRSPSYSDRSYYSHTRLVIRFTGEIQHLRWNNYMKNWSLIWLEPTGQCGALNACGNFGSCNSNSGSQLCKCLPGFQPTYPDVWYNYSDFSDGCKRESQICGESDMFLRLKMMKVRDPDREFKATDETECRQMYCAGNDNCNCNAYSYDNSTSTPCRIWTGDLTNLQEENADGGLDLSVRVNESSIESTVRDCKPCGTYMIPYPLSSGTDCGDPMYMNFECNISSGQVSFKAPNRTSYRVTNIYPKARKFVIQAKGAGDCEAQNSRGKILKLEKPFQANNWCRDDKGDSSPDRSPQGRDEIEISWDPPPEPICNISSPAACKDWQNSTCKETLDRQQRCLCNAHFQWDGSTLSCVQGRSPWKMSRPLIIVTVIVPIALICTIVCLYLRRRRAAKRKENRRKTQQNQALQFCDNELRGKDWIASNQFREEDKKDIDVPFFDLESILAATNNFSDENKLGRGGFGPVYKGKFPGGREIAIKRLLSVSGQGLEEFKNEVILIAKLQHRNLVRLLGYCIEREEKLLLYEYMPNKSLDSFIFDRKLCMVLDWELRFNIILGIARGLLYLHQDSRLRIIHRDLKTSNILLDAEKNPKISDFGLARIFEGKQTDQEETKKVCGTYGYMSPEYANFGVISVKSDVFSFGVVILEIISGKRNIDFYHSEETLSLLGYAWRLWNEDKAIDLMEQTLSATCKTNEFLKCVNVGLLCVQEDPNDRPNMSKVFSMLDSETATLPTPKQPAFITSSSTPKTCSNNELTISTEEGR